jgi:hypothetical protein
MKTDYSHPYIVPKKARLTVLTPIPKGFRMNKGNTALEPTPITPGQVSVDGYPLQKRNREALYRLVIKYAGETTRLDELSRKWWEDCMGLKHSIEDWKTFAYCMTITTVLLSFYLLSLTLSGYLKWPWE